MSFIKKPIRKLANDFVYYSDRLPQSLAIWFFIVAIIMLALTVNAYIHFHGSSDLIPLFDNHKPIFWFFITMVVIGSLFLWFCFVFSVVIAIIKFLDDRTPINHTDELYLQELKARLPKHQDNPYYAQIKQLFDELTDQPVYGRHLRQLKLLDNKLKR